MGVVYRYIKANWLVVAVATYMLFSVLLKIVTGINITIPCFIRLIFHVRCPGCGLTHAFTDLIQLRFAEAWEHNPLIFIVLPFGLIYGIHDMWKFYKTDLAAKA